ncbi:CNOT9-like protein [Mya arenaria]|uniref:CCR4-NOT transcription complex subunit 9 n=1 Tax=Mya arenaria TaxID=6604 RepID=A0ABY7DD86_MYAAR|nr:CNOT9-like protein [Mya arenaria]
MKRRQFAMTYKDRVSHDEPWSCSPTSGSGSLMTGSFMSQAEREKVYQWIGELTSPDTRENALQELSKKRDVVPDLAPMLWHSFGTVAALLQGIVHVYPAITPPHLTAHQSNRVCNALALLQCVASHPETHSAFLTEALRQCLTDQLKDRPFVNCLKNDNFTKR